MNIRLGKVMLWDIIWAQKAEWPKVGSRMARGCRSLGALGDEKGVGIVGGPRRAQVFLQVGSRGLR